MSENKCILVVEDEEALRITLAANLELLGYDVLEAEDAHRAIELLEGNDVHLILSDVRMPGMSGIELQRKVRQARPDVPFVLMTAYTDEASVEEAILGGVFTVLSKPFEVEDAAALIDRAMRRPLVIILDEPDTDARRAAEALRAAGVRAEWLSSGDDLLRAVQDGSVDVCVVSLALHGVDGVNVIRSIRNADPSVVLIALCDHQEGAIQHAAAYRIHSFLQKPVDLMRVVRAIAAGRGGHLAVGTA